MGRVRRVLIAAIATVAAAPLLAQNPRVAVTFAPQNKNPQWNAAAEEYRGIWTAEGGRIIEAMERATTLKFPEKKVNVEIYEAPSFSGRRGGPMRLRASYPAEIKKGVLVHEFGHRMNGQLRKRPLDLDEHRLLFLYLYELWEDLYGKEFADKQVAFEKTLRGLYDYEGAWNWALSMSRDERRSRFAGVLKANRR